MKVTLYIATHNKTNLKYFGKTAQYHTQEELQKYYHGSGLYWKRYLKKHGDNVTMEIYGIYEVDEVEKDITKREVFKIEFNDGKVYKILGIGIYIVQSFINFNGEGTYKPTLKKYYNIISIESLGKYMDLEESEKKEVLGDDGI